MTCHCSPHTTMATFEGRAGQGSMYAKGHRIRIVLLSCFFFVVAHARSSGPSSCDARSGHGSSTTDDGGYTLTAVDGSVDLSSVAPSTQIELALTAPTGASFKGFVVHSGGSGTVAVKDSLLSKTVSSCNSGNSVGHQSSSGKTSVAAYFTTPSTDGNTTITAQFVSSKMTVYQQTIDVTVVGASSGDEEEDEEEEVEDDENEEEEEEEEDVSDSPSPSSPVSATSSYQFSSILASDTTLRWTVGPADAARSVASVDSDSVQFALETTRANSKSIMFSFQQSASMVPALAVVGWLSDDGTNASVGSYSLNGYGLESVVGPAISQLVLSNTSVARVGQTFTVTFVVSKSQIVTALANGATVDSLFSVTAKRRSVLAAPNSARVAYAVSSSSEKSYHNLGRGAFTVDLARGGLASSEIPEAQKLRKLRFLAHGACALVGLYCMTVGGFMAAFRSVGGDNISGGGSTPSSTSITPSAMTKYWFLVHRVCQYSGSIFITVAFILALVQSDKESNTLEAFDWTRGDVDGVMKAHGVIGILLVALVVAQVLAGVFREPLAKNTEDHSEKNKSSGKKPLRSVHFVLGWFVLGLLSANCIIGTGLFDRLVSRLYGEEESVTFGTEGGSESVPLRGAAWTAVAVVGFGFLARLATLKPANRKTDMKDRDKNVP